MADRTSAGPADATAGARRPGVDEPLEFLLAPVEPGEDMGPVARALANSPAPGRSAAPPGSGDIPAAPASGGGPSPRLFDDWRRLLDRERPFAAVVNPPFHRIAEAARECLARGIHVLAEKPLATTWEDLEALRALCRPDGPRLMAMLTMRYDGAFRAARRLLAAGAIGTPVLFSAQKSYPLEGWDGGARPGFYRRRSEYGGTIPWAGIHLIDLFSWFSGSAFTEVSAAATRLGNRGHGELESAAVLRFGLASGALATAHLDYLRRRPMGAESPWGDDRLRVAGELGILEVRDGRVRVDGPEGTGWTEPDPPASLFADFLAWAGGGAPMALSTEDCIKAAEAALRARDAADQGRVLAF